MAHNKRITHKENSKKAKTIINLLTLDELFDRILSFAGQWKEQEKCIDLVSQYKNGNRWTRKEKIKNE